MSLDHLDQDLLSDFTTEANELIESLDQDLVRLESNPTDLELLNTVFRALHTIKGSAGFLALDPLTEIAHAAEDALNCLRKGEVTLTAGIMTMLLGAVDTIRDQIGEIAAGQMCSAGNSDLTAGLRAVGAAASAKATQPSGRSSASDPGPDPTMGTHPAATSGESGTSWIDMSSSRLSLVPFMADDLSKSLDELEQIFRSVCAGDERTDCATQIVSVAEELSRAVGFFGVEEITREVQMLLTLGQTLPQLSEVAVATLAPRVFALLTVLRERSSDLRELRRSPFDTDTLLERIRTIVEGGTLPEEASLPETPDFEDVRRIDGLGGREPVADTPNAAADLVLVDATADHPEADREGKKLQKVDATIRVDVSRLEGLLNLVGELVLQKNRVLALSRRASDKNDPDALGNIGQIASDLDRVTGDLQLGVMKTRLQPMNKVFSRFPRVIRDLAQGTGKKIELDIVGGDTEVDKSVLESIGDPLVHILRNSADHAIEPPAERLAAGKPETGTIRLSAEHLGNHVLVRVRDDGRGLDPERIGHLAVQRGLVTPEELAAMPRSAILRLIFAPGFSTAEKISNISGRGVGMDVVRSNIQKLNGSVDLDSEFGKGTTVSMRIPLTVAIMPAMMVIVGEETYALPLSSIQEIVGLGTTPLATVNRQPVLRNRDSVLQVIDLHETFTGRRAEQAPFAVVVTIADQSYALLVQGLVGQQEIVIKPLDDLLDGRESSFLSGATVREDGGVSLIVDVATLTKCASRSLASVA